MGAMGTGKTSNVASYNMRRFADSGSNAKVDLSSVAGLGVDAVAVTFELGRCADTDLPPGADKATIAARAIKESTQRDIGAIFADVVSA